MIYTPQCMQWYNPVSSVCYDLIGGQFVLTYQN